jgi:hypothetical protein
MTSNKLLFLSSGTMGRKYIMTFTNQRGIMPKGIGYSHKEFDAHQKAVTGYGKPKAAPKKVDTSRLKKVNYSDTAKADKKSQDKRIIEGKLMWTPAMKITGKKPVEKKRMEPMLITGKKPKANTSDSEKRLAAYKGMKGLDL